MTVRLAILDLGATLVTGPPRGPASRIAEGLGLERAAEAELARALMTRPFTTAAEVAAFVSELVPGPGAGAAPRAEVERVVGEVWTAQHAEARPIPGALAAAAALAASDLELAVVSNIWEPYLAAVRASFGGFLDDHVPPSRQWFSCREGHAKPSPEPFRRVLAAAGVAPAEAVMVGDSFAEDIAPAAALGLGTVWVLHRPVQEAAGLLRVRSGAAPPPGRTVAAIAEVTAAVVAGAAPAAVPA